MIRIVYAILTAYHRDMFMALVDGIFRHKATTGYVIKPYTTICYLWYIAVN